MTTSSVPLLFFTTGPRLFTFVVIDNGDGDGGGGGGGDDETGHLGGALFGATFYALTRGRFYRS